MADYYPLIARAVAGLEKNNGDARRALYERARAALLAQLRGVTPPLSENDITRERLALEESIRKVEGEAARKPVEPPTLQPRVRAPEFPRWNPPAPAPEPVEEEALPPRRVAAARMEAPASRQATARALHPPEPDEFPEPVLEPDHAQRDIHREERYEEPAYAHAPDPEPLRPMPPRPPIDGPGRRSLLDQGLNDFRNVVSETNELGEAPARAARSARDMYSAVAPQQRADHRRGDGHSYDPRSPAHDYPVPELLEPARDYDDPPVSPAKPARGPAMRRKASGRSIKELVKTAALLLILAGLGSLGAWQWPNIQLLYRAMTSPSTPAKQVAQDTGQPKRPAKIPDRFEPGATSARQGPTLATAPATAPAAAVAQKVVLYEEDPENPQGKRFVGSAIWRTERVSPGPNQPPEIAVRADVEIPERRLAMTWSLRRNTDKSLPATHTVEIVFKLPSDFPAGGISNVPGILMKQAEQTRGVPLAGLAVKVTNEFFLIGLSAIEADRDRNVAMLKDRAWFDIPVVYNNNRRAILAVEKGTPGERVFAEAFAAWKQ
jgi:hypothetical protein